MKKDILNFPTFKRSPKPNNFLVCPKDYCQESPDELSPVYPVNLEELKLAWQKVILSEPRTEIIYQDTNYIQALQVSFVFRFQDIIHIKLLSVTPTTSTFAIYSYAKLGHSDFGVNRKRVQRWMNLLAKQLSV